LAAGKLLQEDRYCQLEITFFQINFKFGIRTENSRETFFQRADSEMRRGKIDILIVTNVAYY